jgi:ribose transport system ATP-binding protein
VVEPTAGTIRVDGRDYPALTVNDAINSGIAFVHQELNLFDNLDAASNILIGREPLYGGPLRLIDRKALHAKVQPLLDKLGVDFKPDTPVAALSLAQRQLLEIAKALSLDARLVIMDEPTSSLTLAETDRLMKVIAGLKADGVSVIFITHRLNEVRRCADRVVVLRDGRVVGKLERGEIAHDAMIRLMIGRDLKALYLPPATAPGRERLEIIGLRTATYPGRTIDLAVRSGEILGLAGLVGSGRSELARAIFGIDRLLGGSVRLDGEPIVIASPRDAIARGIYLVPEDRKREGLLLDLSVAGNISLPDLLSHSRGRLVMTASEAANAERQKARLNIRTPAVSTAVGSLSGGNQQKVVLAKWLAMRPRVLIFDEPTRGIDVGARAGIYDIIVNLAKQGVAVIVVSSDLEEVLGVSNRILVLAQGKQAGILKRDEANDVSVMELATI